MMIKLMESKLVGCYEIQPKIFKDDRGVFIKTFHEDIFKQFGLRTDFAEEYYSVSKKNVLRGLHFQTPPMEHTKLVYCTQGSVIDAVVDLRKGSATYGEFAIFQMSAEKANMVYIPEGFAHGFSVLSDSATMLYKVTSVYLQGNDEGIRWNSVQIPWKNDHPIMSDRDKMFPALKDFDTPFILGVKNP